MKKYSARVKRHLGWVLPLVAAPVILSVASFGSSWISRGLESSRLESLWWGIAELVLGFVGLVGPVVALVVAAVRGGGAFRHWRRSGGHFTKTEAALVQRENSSEAAWQNARALQQLLARGEVPPSIHVWDVVANPHEIFYMDVPADYARHYGTDVTYSQTSAFYYGRPAFVLAGLGATALSNAARRNAAANQAAAQWRERQPCRLVVTSQRLMCQLGGRWLSFSFSAMTAVYPETENWALITQYDSTSPLMLSGVHVPAAALFTVLSTHGVEAVIGHPSLQKLSASNVIRTP